MEREMKRNKEKRMMLGGKGRWIIGRKEEIGFE
jgi:hypothetical protein